ncbi:YrbI family phosphatase [Alcanivorax hongdengensis A-11-3]|uniref:3-deoxy-D-manno-octulosonate 8-phosphate phosphatase KdsC n=1 Tax=Alcanivorax hongdengensis A-11-3 TaxID=1177179 RepID=L0WB26_9GAMM|nr:HAD hydrolase family protein [Alcanivorax hongdengensis]EKF74181.1 YrbI family phosphatase [Alcanivorax hongdengensis A-11-3]
MSLQISSVDAQNLRLMAFDVDGVMTDGRLYFTPEGEYLKVFNTLDGHGIKKLAASGVTLAIITGRNTPMVAKRAADLGIEHVIQGREDKGVALAALAEELGIQARETGYAGDDEPDVSALQWAQLSFAPANAHACAREAADHVTVARGGEGAVREICDAIISHRSRA